MEDIMSEMVNRDDFVFFVSWVVLNTCFSAMSQEIWSVLCEVTLTIATGNYSVLTGEIILNTNLYLTLLQFFNKTSHYTSTFYRAYKTQI